MTFTMLMQLPKHVFVDLLALGLCAWSYRATFSSTHQVFGFNNNNRKDKKMSTMISDNISTTPRQCKHRTMAAHNNVYGLNGSRSESKLLRTFSESV